MATESEAQPEQTWRRPKMVLLLAATVLTTGGFGYVIGAGTAHSSAWGERLESPEGRIGYRMMLGGSGSVDDATLFSSDVEAATDALGQPEGTILRLMLELRGIGQEPDVNKAAATCRSLAWTRCDELALLRMREELEK